MESASFAKVRLAEGALSGGQLGTDLKGADRARACLRQKLSPTRPANAEQRRAEEAAPVAKCSKQSLRSRWHSHESVDYETPRSEQDPGRVLP